MPVRQVIVRNPLRKLVSPPTVFPGYQRKWAGSLTAGVGIPQLVSQLAKCHSCGRIPWNVPLLKVYVRRAHGYSFLRFPDSRAANLWNIISVFCWKNFRILSNFSVSLNLFLTRLKTFIRQLPIYSGGTHPLPVETLVDSFGTTGTGSEVRKRATTTCGREKIECFGD